MQTASYEDFKAANASKMDDDLMVRFFYKEREDKAATLKEGRPCFKEVEYVEIRVPGNRDPQACRPATHRDKERFPRHYEAFQRRTELPEEGTLLKEWPQVSRSQVEELSFLNVKTVEQLAAMADTHANKLHGGYILKDRAQKWLEQAGESKLIAEKEALQSRLNAMEARLLEMQELMAQQVDDKALASGPGDPIPARTDGQPPLRASRKRKKPAEV